MKASNKNLVILNTITLAIMLFANYLAGAGGFSNITVAEVSYKYDTLFTPAGYAFAIWGVIFLLCICFVVYQWVLLKHNDPKQYIKRTEGWFAISNLANAAWLYCWTSELLGLSVICIIILLSSLCMLTVKLGLELNDEPVRTIFFVWWPIALYLGWIMVATIACIAAWLISNGWRGGDFGEDAWTIVLIAVACLLYLILVKICNLREAASVGIWAFIAILVRQWNSQNDVAISALGATIILLIAISIHGYKNRYYSPFEKIKRKEW